MCLTTWQSRLRWSGSRATGAWCASTAFAAETLPLPAWCFHCLRGGDTAVAWCFHCLRGGDNAFAWCFHCLHGGDTAFACHCLRGSDTAFASQGVPQLDGRRPSGGARWHAPLPEPSRGADAVTQPPSDTPSLPLSWSAPWHASASGARNRCGNGVCETFTMSGGAGDPS